VLEIIVETKKIGRINGRAATQYQRRSYYFFVLVFLTYNTEEKRII